MTGSTRSKSSSTYRRRVIGSSSRENNSGQANAANAAATAQAQQASATAADQNKKSNALFGLQFGDMDKSGKLAGNGSLSSFFDPSKLNVDHPTGPYAAMYTNQVAHQAQDAQQARGNLYASLNSRGFGDAPSGAAADQMRKMYLDQSQAKGDTFANFTGQSYQDALSNFWNAQNIASGSAADLRGNSATNSGHAQQTYTSMYGTAAQPVTTQSPWGAIAGAALGAGGQIGAAALTPGPYDPTLFKVKGPIPLFGGVQGATASGASTCPVRGSLILLPDGSEKAIHDLRKGDQLKGITRINTLLADPEKYERDCVQITMANGLGNEVSREHSYPIPAGGYVIAASAEGESLITKLGESKVSEVSDRPNQTVYYLVMDGDNSYYYLVMDGDNSYRVNGIWSYA